MSSIYINEPLTNGKVLVVTTLGDIDVELWSKEAPLACRNFVQLCMEGYYNGTIFHRIIKDFVAQGGDPSGTGQGGESAFGKPFKDEFHQRLRFVRRGLVAMANGGPNDNASQFFFTLGRCDELNKKNTIFGKVTGNTVFNMIRFNEILTDKDDRPIGDPPKIIKTEILSNPFTDIVPREVKQKVKTQKEKKPKSQSKATKNFSLLSFGEEAVEDEEEITRASSSLKIKSSHDVLTSDPKLSSQPAIEDEEIMENRMERGEEDIKEKEQGDNEFDTEMAGKVRDKLKRSNNDREQVAAGDNSIENVFSYNRSKKRKKELQKESVRLKKEMLEAKRRREEELRGKQIEAEDRSKLPTAVQEFKAEQDYYRDVKLKGTVREEATMKLLSDFKSRVMTAKVKKAAVEEGEELPTQEPSETAPAAPAAISKDEEWMSHRLVFEDDRIVRAKDVNALTSEDSYDLFDPRNPISMRRREEQPVPSKKKQTSK